MANNEVGPSTPKRSKFQVKNKIMLTEEDMEYYYLYHSSSEEEDSGDEFMLDTRSSSEENLSDEDAVDNLQSEYFLNMKYME